MYTHHTKVNNRLIFVMALSAGIIVANVYYNQPVLHAMSISIGVSDRQIGRVAMLSQLGYGLGMFFLVPLGDKLRRKELILLLTFLLIAVLVLFALSSSFFLLCCLSFLTGLLSCPAQIILPMAASISKADRGKTVGKVFSGILVGILGARVISGLVSEWFGWRYVYGLSACLVLIACILIKLYLPDLPSKFKGSYGHLLKSTISLVGRYSVLRQASLLGAFTFGIFCSFWTTLTFHLSAPPLDYSTGAIGLLGLIAIGGAIVAPVFGKLADRGYIYKSLSLTVSLIIGSILLIKAFPGSLVVLSASIFFLDIGVQATQITNFTRIYSLHEDMHSRLNTIYMTTYFIGAALGTYAGLFAWGIGGWSSATLQMLIWGLIAMIIVALSWISPRKTVNSVQTLKFPRNK